MQVLGEQLNVPVECYLTCPGPVPLFSDSLETLTVRPAAAVQCLQDHGLAIMQVLPLLPCVYTSNAMSMKPVHGPVTL